MSDKLAKTLIGALIAVALALAVSYGLISQDTADKVKNQTNEILADKPENPPAQQPAPHAPAPQQPAPQQPAPQAPAPPTPGTQSPTAQPTPAPAPRQ